MSDIKPEPMIETARRVILEHLETLEALHKGGVEAAPESAYAPEDRAFYKFWYAHMKDDQMQPPLSGVRHTDARYIWNAAAKQAAELEREECARQLDALGCDHCAAALRNGRAPRFCADEVSGKTGELDCCDAIRGTK